MKRAIKFIMLAVVAALAVTALTAGLPVLAQGGGGTVIEGTFGSGPTTLHPFYCNGTDCIAVTRWLYSGLLYVNPDTQNFEQTGPGAMAESWTVDGNVVTVTLKEGLTWNDGTPITSQEWIYAWNAINNPDAAYVNSGIYTGALESVEAPDDRTLVFTFQNPSCEPFGAISFSIAPSHVLGEDLAALPNQPYATAPNVTNGPFNFQEYRAGDQTTLVVNPGYTEGDGPGGVVVPDAWIQKVVPDQNVMTDQFLEGQITLLDAVAPGRLAEILERGDAGTMQIYQFPGNSWDYLALNQADPTNPQNGVDENGNPIDQGTHPLFGDNNVRRAIGLALDVDAMRNSIVFGRATRMATQTTPGSWYEHPDLEPLPFDPTEAERLLDEAGWVKGADGIREKDGVRFSFNLYTNQGNTRRTAIGEAVRDQLAQVGVEVNFQTIEFNTLIERFRSQTVDAWILGWRAGYPNLAVTHFQQIWSFEGDVVGSGSNSTSWHNPDVEQWIEEAATLPGCDPDARAEVYWKIQEAFQQDLPYIPLFVLDSYYAAQTNVQGWDPRPQNWYWNMTAWTIQQ